MKYPVDPLKTCLHLRCKQMFYGAERSEEEQEELETDYGRCDTTAYWCGLTELGRGPDDEPCSREECSEARRPCFVGVKSIKSVTSSGNSE